MLQRKPEAEDDMRDTQFTFSAEETVKYNGSVRLRTNDLADGAVAADPSSLMQEIVIIVLTGLQGVGQVKF